MIPNREEVILKIEELEKELATMKKILRLIDRSGMANRTGAAMKFYNVRPGTAVKLILREKGPRTQEELMTELVAGGAVVGKKRAAHNIRISIEKTLRNGTLKQVGDLIGLGEWDESMFRKSA